MATSQFATTTMLFTDIEGSTRLLQELGDRYAEVLEAHRRLIHNAVEDAGGREFGTEGDAIFSSFPRATEAIRASVEAQRALAAQQWPGGKRLKVRMGIHSGEVQETGAGYVGLDVHRAARILQAAHGGQILISETTRALTEEQLPPGVEVKDLGRHRLKDLARPQPLYQVLAPGLPDVFPALRSLTALPNNLPIQLTSFIGRERELSDLRRALSTTRLLTLLGPGGSGKTRLAIQAAAEVLEEFSDGVWLVELAPLQQPEIVPQAIVSALGIREMARPAIDTLRDFIRTRNLLIVFDNCEHLAGACADLSREMLQTSPSLRIVATTREILAVPGELTYQVPPLSLPEGGENRSPMDLGSYESIRLFVERAAFYKPGFMITERNGPAIAQICRRLDGLPLAIELAAARVRVLSVEQIASRLDDRFRLLTGGVQTQFPHHRTLRAAMDWSHDLLNPAEQALLRRLSVFAGGFTLEAAEAVCRDGDVASENVLDLITGIVDKSWVLAEEAGDEVRYRMLETIREYGRERLSEANEEERLQSAHLRWFVAVAEQAEPELQGPHQRTWLHRLELEHDNIRTALGWAMTSPSLIEDALRLGAALSRFWEIRGYLQEGRRWLEDLLARAGDRLATLRARALHSIAFLALRQGDFNRVVAAVEEAMTLSRTEEDPRVKATSLTLMGMYACARADYGTAEALGGESLALCRRLGDKPGIAHSLYILGLVARSRREFEQATSLLEQSADISRELGDRWGMATAFNELGLIAREQGDLPQASRLGEQSVALARELGDRWAVGFGLSNLGILAWRQGNWQRAGELFRESLSIRRDLDDRPGIAVCFLGLSVVAESEGRFEDAARFFGAAEALREAIEGKLPPFIRDTYEDHRTAIRESLGAEAFETAWKAGRIMTFEQAVAGGLEPTSRQTLSPSRGGD